MQHDLISLTSFPSMPAPFSSAEPGEAWVWGDFVAMLQVRPKSVSDALKQVTGTQSKGTSPMEYPFAMSVFYQKDKNPHGPSSRPVIVATLEKADYGAIASLLGGASSDLAEFNLSDASYIVKGLFTATARFNLGNFDLPLSADSARECLFDIIRGALHLRGDPVRIGTIADIHGHPNTGWPAQPKAKTGGSGCLVLVAAIGLALVLICIVIVATI